MIITLAEVETAERQVQEQIKNSTPEEARARLIACGFLKEDGSRMTPADYEEKWLHIA